MAKLKEETINNLTEEDFEKYYGVSDMEYFDLMDEWNEGKYSHLNPDSPNFDEELDRANPHYSELTISQGIKHAFDSMQVTEEEVGRDVFTNLFEEKMLEYIKSKRFQ